MTFPAILLLAFAALLIGFFVPPWPFQWWGYLTEERSIFGWFADRHGPRTAAGIVVVLALVLTGCLALLMRYGHPGG